MSENLIIRIREDGSLKVRKNMKDIGTSARGAAGGVDFLRKSLGLLGGVLAVRSVIQYSDAYTQLQNRLKLVTEGSSRLRAITEELRQTANETRTAFSNTAEFYARAALASKELGVSQRQLLDMTRSVNQAIILSGATGVEAEKGLIQFAQGIASGSLRGDELRSVLEQLPLVADVIAKQLGVTRGELRALGAQGKITSEVILKAFKNAREELEEKFAKTVPTIQQSFSVLRNEVVVFIGRLNESRGVASKFSKLILELSKHVDTFARVIASGAIALGIIAITNALKGMAVVILLNPIGTLVTVLVLAIGTLTAFSDQIGVANNGLVTLQDVAIGFFQAATRAMSTFVNDTIKGYQQIFGVAGSALAKLNLSFKGFMVAFARIGDALLGILEAVVLQFRAQIMGLGDIAKLLFSGDFSGAANRARTIGVDMKEAFLTGLGRTDLQDVVMETFDNAAAAAAARMGKRAAQMREPVPDLTETRPSLLEVKPGKEPKLTVQDVLQQLQVEGELLKMNNRERETEAELLRIIDALRKAGAQYDIVDVKQIENQLLVNQKLRDQADLLEEIRGPQEQARIQIEALNILYDEGRITLDEFNNKLAELNYQLLETDNSLSGAAKGFLRGLIQPAESLNRSLEQAASGGLQAFGTALADTFRNAGNIGDFFDNFKAGLSDVLGQLAQLTLRLLIIQSITALGGGGFLASIGVTSARPFGGTVQGGRYGRMMRVGEQGPENVFVGAGQQANVQPTVPAEAQRPIVNVIPVADPRDVPAYLNSTEGGETIVQLVSRNKSRVRAVLGI